MQLVRFIFVAAIETLALLFLGLLAAKSVAALRTAPSARRRPSAVQWGLYALILAFVVLRAVTLGYDVAAEVYVQASDRQLAGKKLDQALINAQRAVELRPAKLRYWQALSAVKFAQKQYGSALADAPALQALAGGKLEESDAYRMAVSHFLLGEYDKVHPLTQTLIQENRDYAAPYVLEGYTLLAERHYGQATRIFLEVLQMFPDQQSAVEGLAHAQYLAGNRAAALSVLDQTAKFRFAPAVRQRFEALKGLYAFK